ncbi:hypothetical protein BC938DRAFT_478226 [Jimgerdemannia flammicorona]|uniref:Uncharacterized protein n=1 Tax=Jimgerdemannia flammicorona TaxID=994334 RepID=A0A433QN73_9FUNG|nr:hypothetical protein BC938DRAFT_478226 [Jimgerdemannia flammicorona]
MHEALPKLVIFVIRLARVTELDHADLEVIEGAVDEAFFFLVVDEEMMPERVLAQHLGITQDHHAILGPGQRNVQPPGIVQETDALVLVASHQAQNDIVLFSALEGVHARDLYLFVEILAHRPVELHVADDIGSLPFVGGDDADLRGHNTSLHETSDYLLTVGGFGTVEIRGTRGGNLFLTQVGVEKHGCLGDGPGEVNVLAEPLLGGDAVLQGALVEHVTRELGKARVHAVLNLQANRPDAQDNETFEEGLAETRARGLLVHNDRTELLMIADKHGLLAA